MKSHANKKLPARLLGVVIALFALTHNTQAQPGTWTSTTGGSWINTANWSGSVIASGSGNTADFSTLTLASSPIVTLDGPRTIGNLVFGDVGNTFNWTLTNGTGGPLTLAGSPTITVNNQNATNWVVLAGSSGMTKGWRGQLCVPRDGDLHWWHHGQQRQSHAHHRRRHRQYQGRADH